MKKLLLLSLVCSTLAAATAFGTTEPVIFYTGVQEGTDTLITALAEGRKAEGSPEKIYERLNSFKKFEDILHILGQQLAIEDSILLRAAGNAAAVLEIKMIMNEQVDRLIEHFLDDNKNVVTPEENEELLKLHRAAYGVYEPFLQNDRVAVIKKALEAVKNSSVSAPTKKAFVERVIEAHANKDDIKTMCNTYIAQLN